MTEQKTQIFAPFSEDEVAGGIRYVRDHDEYQDLAPDKATLKVDFFLLMAIGKEIARRRTRHIKLALLTGTVVREFVPDDTPNRRRLGEAYRDAIMELFRRRKGFQQERRRTSETATEYPLDKPDQPRML